MPKLPREKKELELGTLRSYQSLVVKEGAPDVPPNFPSGPWTTREEAKEEIAEYCRNPATGDGGHGVVWGLLRVGCSSRGPQSALLCHAHRSDSCNFRINLEQFTEGWALRSTFGDHSTHELAHSVAEANTVRSMRNIPPELMKTAKDMVASGISVSAADRYLRHQVQADGGEPTWNYQDVYHATGATTRQRALDATGFSELLFKREREQCLFHRLKTDEEGRLSHAFFVMSGAHEIYAIDPDHMVVEFDTKARCTHQCILHTLS